VHIVQPVQCNQLRHQPLKALLGERFLAGVMVTCMMRPVSGDRMCLKCSGIARSNESVRAQTAWLQARLSGVHSEFWD